MRIVDITQVVRELVDLCGKSGVLSAEARRFVSDLAGGDINSKCRNQILEAFDCGAVSKLSSEDGLFDCVLALTDICGWDSRNSLEIASSFAVALGLKVDATLKTEKGINDLFLEAERLFCRKDVSGNLAAAYSEYRKAAILGHVKAQRCLGDCCLQMADSDKRKEALLWYEKAASKGDAESCLALGEMYSGDKVFGILKDNKEAIRWFSKAIERKACNCERAKLYIGQCYLYGDGVVADYDEAVRWFRLVSDSDNQVFAGTAQRLLGFCSNYGLGVKENQKEAFLWYYKAAMNGDSDAQNELGNFYRFGTGVPVNLDMALLWYTRSSENGCGEAYQNVMYCRSHGACSDPFDRIAV